MGMLLVLGAVSDLVIVAAILGTMIAFAVLAWSFEKRRLRTIGEVVSRAGFQVRMAPTPEEKAEAFNRAGLFRDLKTGSSGVVWCAEGPVQGRTVGLLEHRYTTGSGKSRTTHRHVIATLSVSERWPALGLAEENVLHKIAELLGSKDIRLESEAFNRRWRVTTDDENFAMVVLTPAVQEWALKLEPRTLIRVGRGGVSVATKWKSDAASALRLASRAVELASLLPPELDAWGT